MKLNLSQAYALQLQIGKLTEKLVKDFEGRAPLNLNDDVQAKLDKSIKSNQLLLSSIHKLIDARYRIRTQLAAHNESTGVSANLVLAQQAQDKIKILEGILASNKRDPYEKTYYSADAQIITKHLDFLATKEGPYGRSEVPQVLVSLFTEQAIQELNEGLRASRKQLSSAQSIIASANASHFIELSEDDKQLLQQHYLI